MVVRLGAQLVQRHGNARRRVAATRQPIRQQRLLDIAVAVTVAPVNQIALTQFVEEERDDTILGVALGLPDDAHVMLPLISFSSACKVAMISPKVGSSPKIMFVIAR